MSDSISSLPELVGCSQFVRIPPELDVPLTARVRAVLDSAPMQRLKEISQLGLVSLVYPGAVHTRFEHSLGVYRLACQVLKHLAQTQSDWASTVAEHDAKIFLLAALLHDVGHWPYCHPIEDMRLPEIARHESVARAWITRGSLSQIIRDQWSIDPAAVADFLTKKSEQPNLAKLQNLLNGPIDIDKMDYLQRDSLHAGVPYGRNFDVSRLTSSLRFCESSKIAITDKGKTAAEMMVFSRYVMFSEVYWHHSVRSATAMLQRLFFRLRDSFVDGEIQQISDGQFQQFVLDRTENKPGAASLAKSLFGRERKLFKRFSQHNFAVSPDVHAALAHRPFEQLLRCAELLAAKLSKQCSVAIDPDDLLIDAPPVKLEIQFKLDVLTAKGIQPLEQLSPVVRALATDQFDKFVKQVRVFVKPELRGQLKIDEQALTELLLSCANEVDELASKQ